jgi:hypothetical protein
MSGPADLAERLAAIIQQRATNTQMPALGLSVGLAIPPYEEGVSKRDRARQALAGKRRSRACRPTFPDSERSR